MAAYYNEVDPGCCEWLLRLMDRGLIAEGFIDNRDIRDVAPEDLLGYTQVHLFAGIGVWSYALRKAGWSDDMPVWTFSCPCQPFSVAGKKKGFDDERHLWPEVFRLRKEYCPCPSFGEQVAGKDGQAWLDVVSSDLEREGYAVGACSTVACGFGAPNKRQRLYFVADPDQDGREVRQRRAPGAAEIQRKEPRAISKLREHSDGVANTDDTGPQRWVSLSERPNQFPSGERSLVGCNGSPSPTNGFWRNADWLACSDGKWRPVEPGTQPLVDGAPNRVRRIRAAGNAINAEQAAAFIDSYIELKLEDELL